MTATTAAPETPPARQATEFIELLSILVGSCSTQLELASEEFRQNLIGAAGYVEKRAACPAAQVTVAAAAKSKLTPIKGQLTSECVTAYSNLHVDFVVHMESFTSDAAEAPGQLLRRVRADARDFKKSATRARLTCEA